MSLTQAYKPNFSDLFRKNRWFWWGFGLFTLILLVILLTVPVGEEIFWVNARRSPFWDTFFRFGTRLAEIPGVVIGIVLLSFTQRRYLLSLFPLALCVGLTSNLTKRFFAHPRPSLFFQEAGSFDQLLPLENVFLNGGNTSFPSGHTMAGFALYGFIAFAWPRRKSLTGMLFLVLAIIVGLSRIYLIQHFAKDVVVGAMIGVLLAAVWYFLAHSLWGNSKTWLDEPLLRPKS